MHDHTRTWHELAVQSAGSPETLALASRLSDRTGRIDSPLVLRSRGVPLALSGRPLLERCTYRGSDDSRRWSPEAPRVVHTTPPNHPGAARCTSIRQE